jgi:hypothetical protein
MVMEGLKVLKVESTYFVIVGKYPETLTFFALNHAHLP